VSIRRLRTFSWFLPGMMVLFGMGHWLSVAHAKQRNDRIVYVFDSPETGGPLAPQVIFERELAFEARLEASAQKEALADSKTPYAERHVKAALDRHIATTLLASLPVESSQVLKTDPCETGNKTGSKRGDLARRVALARSVLVLRVGGEDKLQKAAEAEGIGPSELSRMLRREALAARYLDMMITPMLEPSVFELHEYWRTRSVLMPGVKFRQARCWIRKMVISQKLGEALKAFWQSSQMRIHGGPR
jgi:hypothetical protein